MALTFVVKYFDQQPEHALVEQIKTRIKQAPRRPTLPSWSGLESSQTLFTGKEFTDALEAETWLSSQSAGSGSLVAAKVLKSVESSQIKDLNKKLKTAQCELDRVNIRLGSPVINTQIQYATSILDEIIERVKGMKSSNHVCRDCRSAVSRKHIKKTECPVCESSDFLLTQTDKKQIQRLEEKRQLLREKTAGLIREINALRGGFTPEREFTSWEWIVGGWSLHHSSRSGGACNKPVPVLNAITANG